MKSRSICTNARGLIKAACIVLSGGIAGYAASESIAEWWRPAFLGAPAWTLTSNHPAAHMFITTAARLSRSPLSSEMQLHANQTPFSAYYIKFIREGGFEPARATVADTQPIVCSSGEWALGVYVTEFDKILYDTGDASIPRSTLRRTLFSLCQLATYAEHLDLSATDDLAGRAAALLAWLESADPADPSIPFFRGWIFYLTGDAPGARGSLGRVTDKQWKRRAEVLDLYIQKNAEALGRILPGAEPWTGLLYTMALDREDADTAARAYMRVLELDQNNLLPGLSVADMVELGSPDANKHRFTDIAWKNVLNGVLPGDTFTMPEKYAALRHLADTSAAFSPAVQELFLGYFRRAVFTRYTFIDRKSVV